MPSAAYLRSNCNSCFDSVVISQLVNAYCSGLDNRFSPVVKYNNYTWKIQFKNAALKKGSWRHTLFVVKEDYAERQSLMSSILEHTFGYHFAEHFRWDLNREEGWRFPVWIKSSWLMQWCKGTCCGEDYAGCNLPCRWFWIAHLSFAVHFRFNWFSSQLTGKTIVMAIWHLHTPASEQLLNQHDYRICFIKSTKWCWMCQTVFRMTYLNLHYFLMTHQ